MNKNVTINTQASHQTQNVVEEGVQEALLAAEFFELIPCNPNTPPSLFPVDSPIINYLETAKIDMEIPLGMDDLIVLAHFGGKRK